MSGLARNMLAEAWRGERTIMWEWQAGTLTDSGTMGGVVRTGCTEGAWRWSKNYPPCPTARREYGGGPKTTHRAWLHGGTMTVVQKLPTMPGCTERLWRWSKNYPVCLAACMDCKICLFTHPTACKDLTMTVHSGYLQDCRNTSPTLLSTEEQEIFCPDRLLTGLLVTTASPGCWRRRRKAAASILIRRALTIDKAWSSSSEIGYGANNSSQ
jgi:hypothetical protein